MAYSLLTPDSLRSSVPMRARISSSIWSVNLPFTSSLEISSLEISSSIASLAALWSTVMMILSVYVNEGL